MPNKSIKLLLAAIIACTAGYYVFVVNTQSTDAHTANYQSNRVTNTLPSVSRQPSLSPIQPKAQSVKSNQVLLNKPISIDERVFKKPDYNQLATYDDDPNTYTSQEYEEAVEAKMVILKDKLNLIKDQYAAGSVTKIDVENQVKTLLEGFVSERQKISQKRLDQTHKMPLGDIIAANPAFFKELEVANRR